jgi:hypothetical protein
MTTPFLDSTLTYFPALYPIKMAPVEMAFFVPPAMLAELRASLRLRANSKFPQTISNRVSHRPTSAQHSRQDVRSPERGQQVVPKQGPPTMSPRSLPDDGGPDDRRDARDGDKIGPNIRLPSCQPSEEEQADLQLVRLASTEPQHAQTR